MNTNDHVIAKQSEWAQNLGVQLIGSQGDRGRKVYTKSLGDNLFQALNVETKEEIENGDGGELTGSLDKPAKIQALHSSSALGVNIFDYWRKSPDLSIITSTCGFVRAGIELKGAIRFEQKFSIDDRFQYTPNLDVIVIPQSGRYKAFAIECKFTEAYSSHKHGGLDRKYLEKEDIWQELPSIKHLAEEISPTDSRFYYLHAAQLIKHILGLNRSFGHAHYRLLYLWYDALGEPGFKHRQEIKEFADIARSDGVVFHEATYQDLIIRLAQHRKDHPKYIAYLTERYL